MDHLRLAKEYYQTIGAKNIEAMKPYLHDEVTFSSPMTTLQGKEAVVEATRHFMNAFTSLSIRGELSSDKEAMIVYDTDIPGVSSTFPGASLLTFKQGLIIKIELFHDASLFR